MIARAAAVADVKPGEGPARCRWAPNTAEKSPHIHSTLYLPTTRRLILTIITIIYLTLWYDMVLVWYDDMIVLLHQRF
jgi:hypothetical protein